MKSDETVGHTCGQGRCAQSAGLRSLMLLQVLHLQGVMSTEIQWTPNVGVQCDSKRVQSKCVVSVTE